MNTFLITIIAVTTTGNSQELELAQSGQAVRLDADRRLSAGALAKRSQPAQRSKLTPAARRLRLRIALPATVRVVSELVAQEAPVSINFSAAFSRAVVAKR